MNAAAALSTFRQFDPALQRRLLVEIEDILAAPVCPDQADIERRLAGIREWDRGRATEAARNFPAP